MKRFMIVLLAVIFTACGSQEPTSPPPEVELSVQSEDETFAVGETIFLVSLRDASGNPVDGATVHVHANMDHEGMEGIDIETTDSVNGVYRVPLEWSMGGGWIVTFNAELPANGGEISATHDYFVEAASSESIINHAGH